MELKADLRNYEANIVVNPFHHHHPHVGHTKVHLKSVSKDGQPHPRSQWHSYSDSAPRLPRSQAAPRWSRVGGGDGGISPTFPISDANKLWPKARQGTPTPQRSINDGLKAWTYRLPRPCCSCIKTLPLAVWDLWAGILLEAGDGSRRMIILSTFRCKDGEVTQSHGVVLQTEEKRLLLRSLSTQTPDGPLCHLTPTTHTTSGARHPDLCLLVSPQTCSSHPAQKPREHSRWRWPLEENFCELCFCLWHVSYLPTKSCLSGTSILPPGPSVSAHLASAFRSACLQPQCALQWRHYCCGAGWPAHPGCSAASLPAPPPREMPGATPYPAVTTQNISRCCQMSQGLSSGLYIQITWETS